LPNDPASPRAGRCRMLPAVDAGSCGVDERRRCAAVLTRLSTVEPAGGALASEACAGVRRLDHRPSWAAKATCTAGRDTAGPQALPCRTSSSTQENTNG
jgi:hypothetical protein